MAPESKKKQNEVLPKEPSLAEKVLQGPELEALLRVLGADGARWLDAAFTRAAVDEMARCVCGVLVYVVVNSVASMARRERCSLAVRRSQSRRWRYTRA